MRKEGDQMRDANVQAVFAWLGGSVTECAREEFDVGFLVRGDLLEASTGEPWETGVCEGLLVELGQGVGVEVVLEMLESEREVQNGCVYREENKSMKALKMNCTDVRTYHRPPGVSEEKRERGQRGRGRGGGS